MSLDPNSITGAIIVEAESLDLVGYRVEAEPESSGGFMVSLRNPDDVATSAASGTMEYTFADQAGLYDLCIVVFDEFDGKAGINVYVDDVLVEDFILNTTNRSVVGAGVKLDLVARDLNLAPGSVVRVEGIQSVGEWAKVDQLVFAPAGNIPEPAVTPTPTPASPTPATTPTPTPIPTLTPIEGNPVLTFEAEDMRLINYTVDQNVNASGGRIAALFDRSIGGADSPREGTAQVEFGGVAGTYDITIYAFDEGDGQSPIDLIVNDSSVGGIVLDQNTNNIEGKTISGVQLNPGDIISLYGEVNLGEWARLDRIELAPAGFVAPTPTPTGDSIIVQAETMNLVNYNVEENGQASGLARISLIDRTLANTNDSPMTGTAETTFTGGTGTWNINIQTFDEGDGVSTLELLVNGVSQGTVTMDANSEAYVGYLFENVQLTTNDTVTISAVRGGAEFARIDFVEFLPQSDIIEPPSSVLVIEAEDMTLVNYIPDVNAGASGGGMIDLHNGVDATVSPTSGTASVDFSGAAGTYDLSVFAMDEGDGNGTVELLVNGVSQGSYTLDQGGGAFRELPFNAVQLNPGDTITIAGTADAGEWARIDRLEIDGAGAGVTPTPVTPTPVTPTPVTPTPAGELTATDVDFFAFAGQSNARRHFTRNNNDDSEGDLGSQVFEDQIESLTGFQTTAINAATGGSASNELADPDSYWWNLGSDVPGPALENAIVRIQNELDAGQTLDGIVWSQGYDDVIAIESIGADSANVAANLIAATLKVFETFRSTFGQDIPIFIQEIGDFPDGGDDIVEGAYQVIRDAQQSIVDTQPNVFLGATTTDLPTSAYLGDGIHFNVSGYGEIATELATNIVDEFTAPPPTPTPTSTYSITADVVSLQELNEGQSTVTFTVSRDLSAGAATVAVALSGSADGSDFTGGVTSVSFLDGETTSTFSIDVLGDSTNEPDETIVATISNPSDGGTIGTSAATVSVLDDDVPLPQYSIAVDTDNIRELNSGQREITFTVTRDLSDTVAVVEVGLSGSADSGDYSGNLTNVAFLTGETTASFTLTVSGDEEIEDDETIVATISNPSDGGNVTTGSVSVTVTNDDFPVVVMEAEDLIVSGFNIARIDVASDGALATVAGASGDTGVLGYTFDGEAGAYDLIVTAFDENDGTSSIEVLVNGRTIQVFEMDALIDHGIFHISDVNRVKLPINALNLEQGDYVEIRATRDRGEHARIDSISLQLTDALTPEQFSLEAEDIISSGFSREGSGISSGDTVASIRSAGVLDGTLSYRFDKAESFYNMSIEAYDENDGVSQIQIVVNGRLKKQFTLDELIDHGDAHVSDLNRVSLSLDDLFLKRGDLVEVLATRSGGELARIDTINFTPTDPPELQSVFMEAEDLIASGFLVENSDIASGGALTVIRSVGVTSGTLNYIYEGATGPFDLELTAHDENDGISIISVSVNGEVVETFALDDNINHGRQHVSDLNRVTLKVKNIELSYDDVIEVTATRNSGELARIDTFSLTPAVQAPINIGTTQVETLEVSGAYELHEHPFYQGGQGLRNQDDDDAIGFVEGRFFGESGEYYIGLDLFDAPGNAEFELIVDDEVVESWTMPAGATASAFGEPTTYLISSPVDLSNGDVIEIRGVRNGDDRARLDAITVSSSPITPTPVTPTPTPVTPTPTPVTPTPTPVTPTPTPVTPTPTPVTPTPTPVTPTPTPVTPTPATTVTIEAETLTLSQFVLENNGAASGGQVISLLDRTVAVGDRPTNGTASTEYSGQAGSFNISVFTIDEGDGNSTIELLVNGVSQGSFVLDQGGDLFRDLQFTNVMLNPGDVISVAAAQDGGEWARIDRLEITGVGASVTPTPVTPTPVTPTPVTPTPTPVTPTPTNGETLTVEAETLALSQFVLENNGAASGGQVISLLDRTVAVEDRPTNGSASTQYSGQAGSFNISVFALDEGDGNSSIELLVNGVSQGVIVLDQGGNLFRDLQFTDVVLNPGDVISVAAAQDGGEWARIDRLEITGVGASVTPTPVTPTPVTPTPVTPTPVTPTPVTPTPVTPTPVTPTPVGSSLNVEAEDHIASGYVSAAGTFASGGAYASLFNGTALTGEISYTFTGQTGLYNIEVFHFDEGDGVSTINVAVDGQSVQTITLDQAGLGGGAQASSRTSTVITGLSLENGAVVTLTGTQNAGEWARIDNFVISPQVDAGPVQATTDSEDGFLLAPLPPSSLTVVQEETGSQQQVNGAPEPARLSEVVELEPSAFDTSDDDFLA